MRSPRSILAALAMLAAALLWAPRAWAFPGYYASGAGTTTSCTTCHTAAVAPLPTCNGCHAHGTHGDAGKGSVNLAASADKTTYAPGENVVVTVTGGYQSGWVRVNLYDEGMVQLARSSCPGGLGGCSTSVLPVTLTTTAPSAPGTYTWRVAWYGNVHEAAGGFTSPACADPVSPPCFRVDPSNDTAGAVHGEEIVAVSQFTVEAAATTPAIAVAPATLAFGNVNVGSSGTQTFTITNTGTATLTGSVIAASGTSGEFAVSPATFSIDAGGQPVTVTVTYTPTAAGADTGGFDVSSNAAASPTISVPVSGTGVEPGQSPPPAADDDDDGCSSGGGSATWLGVVALALLAAARRARVRRATG